jgi:hypothetical protein
MSKRLQFCYRLLSRHPFVPRTRVNLNFRTPSAASGPSIDAVVISRYELLFLLISCISL